MPPSKQYVVRVRFVERNPKTGDETAHEVGQTVAATDLVDPVEKYLKGVDDKGPLIVEKTSATSSASADSSKEN